MKCEIDEQQEETSEYYYYNGQRQFRDETKFIKILLLGPLRTGDTSNHDVLRHDR
jgi:hypothetical protein